LLPQLSPAIKNLHTTLMQFGPLAKNLDVPAMRFSLVATRFGKPSNRLAAFKSSPGQQTTGFGQLRYHADHPSKLFSAERNKSSKQVFISGV
jgi:hypothetical protein